jgi:hypothetical protein
MKKIMIGFIFMISTLVISAQKTITYEEMKTISKGMFESIDCDNYVAKDAHTYKLGDTIKIGRPSSNKSFAFITVGSGVSSSMSGKGPEYVDASYSGNNTIIKSMYVGGSKKSGYKMYVIGKGRCGLCPNNTIDFEEAIATGEIQSAGMTREQAIAKLKEAKDLVDLGMMTKEDFEKLKAELSKIILQK